MSHLRQRIDDEMSDSEMWKAHREAQQERRAKRLPVRTEEILALREWFRVERLTAYQFRINGKLDLYPTHRRYHDLTANKRGNYQSAKAIAVRVLRAPGDPA